MSITIKANYTNCSGVRGFKYTFDFCVLFYGFYCILYIFHVVNDNKKSLYLLLWMPFSLPTLLDTWKHNILFIIQSNQNNEYYYLVVIFITFYSPTGEFNSIQYVYKHAWMCHEFWSFFAMDSILTKIHCHRDLFQ